MKWETVSCPKCGSRKLEMHENGIFYCNICISYVCKNTVEEYNNAVQKSLDSLKQDLLFQRKQSLFKAAHDEYRGVENLLSLCRSVKEIDANDLFANFYEAVAGGSNKINKFFDDQYDKISDEYFDYILDFLLGTITDDICITWIYNIIATKIKQDKVFSFQQKFKDLIDKINSYTFVTNRSRDVFLAYSSKDMEYVVKIKRFLESEGYTVFASYSNLWNGIDAQEKYKPEIEEAIRHCKCVVFISSEHSRHKGCYAIDEEIPYIRDNCPDMKRVEYLLEPYGSETPLLNRDLLKEFFPDQRYVEKGDLRNLTKRVNECVRAFQKEQQTKEQEEENRKKEEETARKAMEEQMKKMKEEIQKLRAEQEKKKDTESKTSDQSQSGEHQHSYIKRLIAATCISKGYTEFWCKCGDSYKTEETELGDHQYELVHQVKPTCEQDGMNYFQCKVCSRQEKKPVPASGHSFGDWETKAEATCDKEGTKVQKCKHCKKTLTKIIPPKGHSYGSWVVTQQPTCELPGSRQKKCSVCGELITEYIPALGHHYEDWNTIPATCEKKGMTQKRCSTCGKIVTEMIPAKGHIYGDWTEIPATCEKQGIKQRNCTICRNEITEFIPAKGHTYGGWKETPATCEKQGMKQKKCSICGNVITKTIPAKGHTYGNWEEKQATCEKQGEWQKKCSTCGNTVTETIPEKGHQYSDWKRKNLISKYRVCKNCGTTENSTLGVVKKTQYRKGNIIYFGRYPQSAKADHITVTQQNGKYIGSDGAEYAKSEGKYFKIEPISWRVLEEKNGYATLLSQKILTARKFDRDSNNYANSEIRKWLNGEFFDSAFSEEQKAIIQTVTVDNSARSTNPDTDSTAYNGGNNPYACSNTSDKVWLLSMQEVTKASYGFNSNSNFYGTSDTVRQKEGTAYAKSQGLYIYSGNGKGCWWLRSPCCYYSSHAWSVRSDGSGNYYYVNIASYGVVPALKIRLS